jgi:Domain of unknown function DUF11
VSVTLTFDNLGTGAEVGFGPYIDLQLPKAGADGDDGVVIVTDSAPSMLTNLTYIAATGTYDPASGEWTGLDLAPGDGAELLVSATVAADAKGTITNGASVALSAGYTDPTPDNNVAADTDAIVVAPDTAVGRAVVPPAAPPPADFPWDLLASVILLALIAASVGVHRRGAAALRA